MNATIKREKFKTEKGKHLYDMLKAVWGNEHWLIGVLANLKGKAKTKNDRYSQRMEN